MPKREPAKLFDAVSPDARIALVGLSANDIRVVDLATGRSTPSTVAATDTLSWQRLAVP